MKLAIETLFGWTPLYTITVYLRIIQFYMWFRISSTWERCSAHATLSVRGRRQETQGHHLQVLKSQGGPHRVCLFEGTCVIQSRLEVFKISKIFHERSFEDCFGGINKK